MSGHTPGPWSINEYQFGSDWSGKYPACAIMCRDNNKVVCEIPDYLTGYFDREDAMLLSAAPELLEALERMTELVIGPAGGVTQADKVAAVGMACEAIAKATGGAA